MTDNDVVSISVTRLHEFESKVVELHALISEHDDLKQKHAHLISVINETRENYNVEITKLTKRLDACLFAMVLMQSMIKNLNDELNKLKNKETVALAI